MTEPKQLTDAQRELLTNLDTLNDAAWQAACDALALIEALTAQVAEMAAQLVTDGARIAELEVERDGLAKYHELLVDAIRRNYGGRLVEAERKLTDLNKEVERLGGMLKHEGECHMQALEASNAAEHKLAAAEARVRELETERDEQEQRGNNYCEAAMAAEQKLADANALLDQARRVLVDWNNYQASEGLTHVPEDETASCLDKLEAYLAGRPAAPSRT